METLLPKSGSQPNPTVSYCHGAAHRIDSGRTTGAGALFALQVDDPVETSRTASELEAEEDAPDAHPYPRRRAGVSGQVLVVFRIAFG